jgi:hypothetical protein
MADDRGLGKNAAGQDFDLSQPASFDFSRFFNDFADAQHLQMSRDEMTWQQIHAEPERSAAVVLNLSCGVQTTPHLMLLQVALFKALGVDFVATAGPQYCCGRMLQRYGKTELGDRMAGKAIRHFASWQPQTNVQCCGSCLIEFDHHVTQLRAATGTAPFEVVHITDFLLDTLKRLGDAVPWRRSVPMRVLLHAEGAELHVTKVRQREAVIETLGLIPGVEFVGMIKDPSLGLPCATSSPGAPSILNDLTPEQYRLVQAELRTQAQATGADAIVTHHHFCHREWSKFGSEAVPVLHYQALLAEALGCPVPDRFQHIWRLRDSNEMVEQTRPYWRSWGISEEAARATVAKHFVPKYAAAVQRCPCEGTCAGPAAATRSPEHSG